MTRRMTGALEERYAFADALAVGTYLNIFTRNCDWVRMANLAQMVNAIAPIVTSGETVAVQPIWYPVLLHAQAALDLAVDVHVTGPVVDPDLPAGASRWPFRVGDLGPFGIIDAAATVSTADGQPAARLVGSAPNGMARLDPREGVQASGRVTFAVDPARLYFFDPDTGRAITG